MVDIKYIQVLLAHTNLRTIEIYTHVTMNKLEGILNPFDKIGEVFI